MHAENKWAKGIGVVKGGATGIVIVGMMTGCAMADEVVSKKTKGNGKEVNLSDTERMKPIEKSVEPKELPPFRIAKPGEKSKGERAEVAGEGSEGPSDQ